MITLFTGSPGAGKTAALVDALMSVPAYAGRPVYVHGLDGLCVPHDLIDAAKWSDLGPDGVPIVPDGSLIVIDEVQHVWRARSVGSTPPPAVAALETHRHRGLDFLLTTQAPALLDVNVRRLVGRHVHIRDTGVLGRYWYEWPECSDSMDWQRCVNKRRWSLPKSAFVMYTSASKHIKPVRSVPRVLFVALLAICAFVVLAYFAVTRIVAKNALAPAAVDQTSPALPAGAPQAPSLPPGQTAQSGAPDVIMDFVPRLPGHPETAKAYDHLRKIDYLPVVDGGICWGHGQSVRCRCFAGSQVAPITADECRQLVTGGPLPYNPYKLASQVSMSAIGTGKTNGAPEGPIRAVP